MPELSNLLRQRLGAQEKGAPVHPDADTLTAFTEQLLPAAERRQVLTHLSACEECRDIVALSQPAVPETAAQPVFHPAPVSFWRRLFTPAFGMAASIAAVALVAVLVLENPQKTAQQQSNQETKAASVADQKTTAEARPSAPVQPQPVDSFTGLQASSATPAPARTEPSAPVTVSGLASGKKSLLPARGGSAASVQPTLTAGLRKQDFLNNAFFETDSGEVVMAGQNSGNLPSAPPAKTLASEAAFTASAPGQITIFSDIPTSAANNKSNVRILTPPPPPERFGCTLCKVVTQGARTVLHRTPGARPAISSGSVAFSAMGSRSFSADLQKGQPAEVAAAPEKSEAAGLERTDALSSRALAPAYANTVGPATWKVIGGKLLKSAGAQWEDAYPAASFQFTAVNAHGNEVWAGGTNAALIHTRDAGATWDAIKLGDAASGSIVSIFFLGNSVQVKTSADQSWSSSDGGKTWAKN